MRRLLCLLLVCFTLGCGDDTSPEPSDTSDMSATDTPDTTAQPDMGGTVPIEMFEIGSNTVEDATPAGFAPMADGTAVPFDFGPQGSWMVVLAFRDQDILEGEFDVRASIEIDGTAEGEIWLEFQETFPGGDGWDYYFNLFLPISGDPPAEGTPMVIQLSVLDGDETLASRTHSVVAGPADDS